VAEVRETGGDSGADVAAANDRQIHSGPFVHHGQESCDWVRLYT
jgi:hypothetical protein